MAATQRNDLRVLVYAPALVNNDARPVAIVHAMERALPRLRLEWTLSDEGKVVPLSHRDEWVVQGTSDGGFPLVCNNDADDRITLYGLEIPSESGPGRQPLFDIHASLPLSTTGIAAAAEVLEQVAEGARAYWGHVTPFLAGVEIARQTRDPVRKPQVPPRGLPALKLPDQLPSPEIPHRLGWLNYWSAAAARAIGFPDVSRDTELLSRARRTATGGWVVRLTDAPLDLDIAAHLDALLRAYERFPAIGGRPSM